MRSTARAAVVFASTGHALCHASKLVLPLVLAAAAADLGVSLVGMAGALSVYLVAMALASVPAGLLADRIGTARVLLLFYWSLAAAAVLCWAANSYGTFVVAHGLLGAAAGLYHPPGLGLISLSTTRDEAGPAMGWHGVASSVGIAATPWAVLQLAPHGGWRVVYLALAAAAAAGALAGHVMLRRRLVPAGSRPQPQAAEDGPLRRRGVLLLLGVVAFNGFLIDGFTTLFPETVRTHSALAMDDQVVNMLVLAVGGVGQYLGGRLARGATEKRRYVIMLMLQPLAVGGVALLLGRPGAAFLFMGGFAFANYMTQPVENRLLAGATTTARRSTAYALKFLVSLLAGAAAPALIVGLAQSAGHATAYAVLALVAVAGMCVGGIFWRVTRTAGPAGGTLPARRGPP